MSDREQFEQSMDIVLPYWRHLPDESQLIRVCNELWQASALRYKEALDQRDELFFALVDIRQNARRLGSVFCECVAENAIAKAQSYER